MKVHRSYDFAENAGVMSVTESTSGLSISELKALRTQMEETLRDEAAAESWNPGGRITFHEYTRPETVTALLTDNAPAPSRVPAILVVAWAVFVFISIVVLAAVALS